MNIGDRIRKTRQQQQKTLQWLATRTGTTRQTIQRYETGEISNIPSDKIEKIALALNVTPSYLMGWERTAIDSLFEEVKHIEGITDFLSLKSKLNAVPDHYKYEADEIYDIAVQQIIDIDRDAYFEYLSSHQKTYKSEEEWYEERSRNIPYGNVRTIKLYSSISCGSGMFVDDNVEEYITLPESLLNSSKEYFCQYADGDSMIGENINPGDLIVFEKAQTIENGQIGCFCIDDNIATCKKFYKDDASAIITLQPANNKYSPIIVTVETMNFHIVGKLALVISKRL